MTTEEIKIPDGMQRVTETEFFEFLKRDTRDIMPTTEAREYSVWRSQRTRAIVGRTYPGWANPGTEKAYFIMTDELR